MSASLQSFNNLCEKCREVIQCDGSRLTPLILLQIVNGLEKSSEFVFLFPVRNPVGQLRLYLIPERHQGYQHHSTPPFKVKGKEKEQ